MTEIFPRVPKGHPWKEKSGMDSILSKERRKSKIFPRVPQWVPVERFCSHLGTRGKIFCRLSRYTCQEEEEEGGGVARRPQELVSTGTFKVSVETWCDVETNPDSFPRVPFCAVVSTSDRFPRVPVPPIAKWFPR